MKLSSYAIGSLLAAAIALPAAYAAPMATSVADITIELTGVTNLDTPGDLDDLLIEGENVDLFTDSFTFMAPGSSASVSLMQTLSPAATGTPVFFEVGSELIIGHDITTSASGTDAFAEADSVLGGFISLDNLSFTDSFEVEFTVSYSGSISTFISDPSADLALADTNIAVENSIDGLLLDLFTELDSLLDGTAADTIPADTLVFTMLIAPGASETASIFSTGFAVADVLVPVPGTLLLLALPLLGLRRKAG